jgi:aspartate 1-decarboxylase
VDENNDPKTIVDETEYGTKYDLKKGIVDNTVVD